MQSQSDMTDDRELFTLLYTELKRRAERQLQRLPPGQTLQPTALVHEVYARLMVKGGPAFQSRSHFFAIAVTAMRNVLVEAIRRNYAAKRGGGLKRVTLTNRDEALAFSAEDVVAVGDALRKLEEEYPDVAHIALLRLLAGFTMDEIASMKGMSKRTVERRWRFAQAWLRTELEAD